MRKVKLKTNSAQETINLGVKFAGSLREKDVVLMEGDLGGGKTTFIKGVLKGLGSKEKILSPSFTLIREYKTKMGIVYHMDLYRLDKVGDIFEMGIEDCLYVSGGISLIEWGERIEDFLPEYSKINFTFIDNNRRGIEFSCKGRVKNYEFISD